MSLGFPLNFCGGRGWTGRRVEYEPTLNSEGKTYNVVVKKTLVLKSDKSEFKY